MVSTVVLSVALSVIITGITLSRYEKRSDDEDRKAAIVVSSLLYANQISACQRGNVFRGTMHKFLVKAAEIREKPPLEDGDLVTAVFYRALDTEIWPLTPCADVVIRP